MCSTVPSGLVVVRHLRLQFVSMESSRRSMLLAIRRWRIRSRGRPERQLFRLWRRCFFWLRATGAWFRHGGQHHQSRKQERPLRYAPVHRSN